MTIFGLSADDYRGLNVLLSAVAVGMLAWRFLGRMPLMSALSRWIVGLLGALLTLVALGTAYAARHDAPFNPVQYLLTVHYLLTIMVCAVWHRWLDPTGRRT